MKKYTLADFNDFKVAKNGDKICPSGDYSLIREFPSNCSFDKSIFDKCIFGQYCSFERCDFGNCSFGEYCSFVDCSFGEYSSFGAGSVFYNCSFVEQCRFGEYCIFKGNCMYNLFEFNELITLEGLYHFPIRIYLNTEEKEYYLAIGCMDFATIKEAREKSLEREEKNDDIIGIVKRIIIRKLYDMKKQSDFEIFLQKFDWV